MRHDPASAAVLVMLRGLKMYGMAQAVSDLIEQGAPAFDKAVPLLSQLLKAEMAERQVRSIAYQMKAARFPAYKDIAGFDFTSSEINEAMVRQLHRGEFIDAVQNVVLIGGPGTGKTHIATALGVQAVEHHRKKVRFFSTVDLVNALEQEKTLNKAGQLAERLLRLDLVILDEANIATHFGLLHVQDLIDLIDAKPAGVELVFTGRKADPELIERADLVSEFKEVRHYYQKGVMARKGIES